MWKHIKEKYDSPDEAKQWVFESVCSAWRKYKSQLKTNHFTTYENDELRMEIRPVDIPKSHFKDLLKYWNSDPHKIWAIWSRVLVARIWFRVDFEPVRG
uniref:Uncharacterized protein isoform X2 n=1 Tax=Nicotiana tabacum TaxID=4097 RepID=A0A1S3XS55_TOBAC|nr:PREDICTED: uncharacterized protein LOC107767913 isoform X2 [Nicotiana tabacum]